MKSALQDKYARYLREQEDIRKAEVGKLKEEHEHLCRSEAKLDAGLKRLREDAEQLGSQAQALREYNRQVEEQLQILRVREKLEPDAVVVFNQAVHKQCVTVFNENHDIDRSCRMFDLVTEDHAIEDAIYYLSKSLNAGTLPLPAFLKHVRKLAVDQFMKRALILKIRQHRK